MKAASYFNELSISANFKYTYSLSKDDVATRRISLFYILKMESQPHPQLDSLSSPYCPVGTDKKKEAD